MIDNMTIYRRAVNLIKDPHLSRSFYYNSIKFAKEMYPFLEDGVSLITMPTGVAALLSEQTPPVGQMEIFEGTGVAEYLVEYPPTSDALAIFYINGEVDNDATYDSNLNLVTFSRPIMEGEKASMEWYIDGGFTGDFTKVAGKFPVQSLISRVTDLLARATVISWASSNQNSLLEGVLNNLTDTDFKVHSPAAALTAKKEWVNSLEAQFNSLQNKLDWDMRQQNRGRYGY